MRFTVRSTAQGYEAKWWLDDTEARAIRFEMPDNTIQAWQLAVRRLFETLEGTPLFSSDSFLCCEFRYDFNPEDTQQDAILERVAFCKFLLALEREIPSFARDDFKILEIFQKHPAIVSLSRKWPYYLLFLSPNDQGILFAEEVDEPQWEYILEDKHQREQSSELIADLLSHQDISREINYQIIRQRPEIAYVVGKNYAALTKAVLRFLDTVQQRNGTDSRSDSSRLGMIRLFQKYRPALCALLVENETLSLNERQEYLELIFVHRMPYEERYALLHDILTDLSEDARQNSEAIVPMQTIAGLMGQYYLNRYALDAAVAIWQKMLAVKKDRFLSTLLNFYRQPWRYLGFAGLLTLLSFLPIPVTRRGTIFLLLPSMPLLVFLSIAVLGLATVSIRFIRRQGFAYLGLFLPRLFGSIVVGLSILALEGTVWEITVDMSWGNWLLAVFASYLGVLTYLFLDVHKNTRLLPGDVYMDNQQSSRKTPLNSIERSLRTTFGIFAMGVLEALGLTVLVSSLIPLEAFGDTFASMLNDGKLVLDWHGLAIKVLENNQVVFEIFGANGFTLAYLPKIVVLWAGLSLLIGAFAQLLWQDRQITAS